MCIRDRWKGEPFLLQEPTKVEGLFKEDEGWQPMMMPAGTLVCEGIYWSRIRYDPGWYESPKDDHQERPERVLFFMEHLLKGDLNPQTSRPSTKFMPKNQLSYHNRRNPQRVKFIPAWRRDELTVERKAREKLEYKPADIVEETEEEIQEANESEDEEMNDDEVDDTDE